jgi:hypothetical protein
VSWRGLAAAGPILIALSVGSLFGQIVEHWSARKTRANVVECIQLAEMCVVKLDDCRSGK